MLPRWILGAGVFAAWACAMAWRVERDCLPRWRAESEATYRTALGRGLPKPSHFRLSYHGREVGELHDQTRYEPDGSIALRQRLRLDGAAILEAWPLLGGFAQRLGLELDRGLPVLVRFKLTLTPEYLIQGFDLRGTLGALPLRGHGVMGPDGMATVVSLGRVGEEQTRALRVPLDPAKPLSLGFSALGGIPDLPMGESWDLQVVNPLTQRVEVLRACVVGRERLKVGEGYVHARCIEVRQRLRMWVDRDGRVLRLQMMGLDVELVDEAPVPDD